MEYVTYDRIWEQVETLSGQMEYIAPSYDVLPKGIEGRIHKALARVIASLEDLDATSYPIGNQDTFHADE